MANIFPIDFEEKLTMAQDDYILFSDSEDGNKIKKAQYKNLKGEQGNPGQDGQDGVAATITIGSVSTGAAGSSATVVNSGTSTNAVLDFSIPQGIAGTDGDDGAAATITVGNTTTGNPGTSATVTNTGTSSAAVLDFTIPQGATGATGNGIASITSSKSGKITTVTITETNSTVDTFQISDGADGTGSGDVSGPASSVDGDVAIFDGATGKLIKDGSVALSTLSAGASAGATAVQPGDIGTAAACNTGTASGNVPILDSNGKLATSTLPGVALTDTFTVSTSADLTTLSSADQGDIAIVTTENKTYVLSVAPYSTAANWKQILSPTGGVTSWNGQTGAVTYSAPVSSVNGSTGAVTVSEFSPTGTATTGYVVTKTAGGYEWADIPVKSVNGQTGNVSVGDIKYSDFDLKMGSGGATLTISDLTKQFTPNQNFTLVSGTVKVGMQYVVRINSGATVRTMTLGSGVTNPFNEDLTLTANKKTTIILLATSTSTLEIFGVRTAV